VQTDNAPIREHVLGKGLKQTLVGQRQLLAQVRSQMSSPRDISVIAVDHGPPLGRACRDLDRGWGSWQILMRKPGALMAPAEAVHSNPPCTYLDRALWVIHKADPVLHVSKQLDEDLVARLLPSDLQQRGRCRVRLKQRVPTERQADTAAAFSSPTCFISALSTSVAVAGLGCARHMDGTGKQALFWWSEHSRPWTHHERSLRWSLHRPAA
jgi:hypothetical protein